MDQDQPAAVPAHSMSDLALDAASPPAELYPLTRWQADIQGLLQPGRWLPGLRTPHAYEESWRVTASPGVCLLATMRAAKQLRRTMKCQVKTTSQWSDQAAATLYFFTDSLSWLDVVNISLTPLDGSTLITLRSCSSGLFPVSFPLAPLLNACLCFFPFYDMDQNRSWISSLKQMFDLEITLLRQYRPC